jgi:hypothetical protein
LPTKDGLTHWAFAQDRAIGAPAERPQRPDGPAPHRLPAGDGSQKGEILRPFFLISSYSGHVREI